MQDVRDDGSIPGSRRSPGGGHGNPLQYSCLENPMDRGPWWATVHRVTESWSQLKWLSAHSLIHRGYVKKKKPSGCLKPWVVLTLYHVFFYACITMITFNLGTVREYPNCQQHYSCTSIIKNNKVYLKTSPVILITKIATKRPMSR